MSKKTSIIIFSLLLLSLNQKTYAYWNVFGYEIPSNLTEIKEKISKGKVKRQTTQKTSGNQGVFETISKKLKGEEKEDLESKQKQVQKPDTSNLTPIYVTSQMIKEGFDSYAKNQEYSGYSAESLDIDLKQNGLITTIGLSGGKKLYMDLSLSSDGKSVIVNELKSVGDTKISGLELSLLKTAIKNAPDLIKKSFPEETSRFEFVEISQNKMTIWLKTP